MSGYFGVNLANVKAAAPGSAVPPGDYVFKVAEVDHTTAKTSGKPRTNIRCEVVAGLNGDMTLQGKSLWHGFNEDDKGAEFFKGFIMTLGITEAQLMQSQGYVYDQMLIGRQFIGRVIVNKEGYTNITGERPMTQNGAGAGAGAPQTAMPQTAMPPAMQPGIVQQQFAPQNFGPQNFGPPQGMMAPPAMPQQNFAAPMQTMAPPSAAQPPAAMPGMPGIGFPAAAPPPGTVPGQQ